MDATRVKFLYTTAERERKERKIRDDFCRNNSSHFQMLRPDRFSSYVSFLGIKFSVDLLPQEGRNVDKRECANVYLALRNRPTQNLILKNNTAGTEAVWSDIKLLTNNPLSRSTATAYGSRVVVWSPPRKTHFTLLAIVRPRLVD